MIVNDILNRFLLHRFIFSILVLYAIILYFYTQAYVYVRYYIV